MVKGGTHPQGKTTVVVPATLGYDELGSIFYQANTNCLTESSNFAHARFCTADVFGGSHKANIHLAWDAVGVPNDLPFFPPSNSPTLKPSMTNPPTRKPITPTKSPTSKPTSKSPTRKPTIPTARPSRKPTWKPRTDRPTPTM